MRFRALSQEEKKFFTASEDEIQFNDMVDQLIDNDLDFYMFLEHVKKLDTEDGRFFLDLFPNPVSRPSIGATQLQDAILSQKDSTGRSLFFASFAKNDLSLLKRSSSLGYGFAIALDPDRTFDHILQGAKLGFRCLQREVGLMEHDGVINEESISMLELAARRGDCYAMLRFGEDYFDRSVVQFWMLRFKYPVVAVDDDWRWRDYFSVLCDDECVLFWIGNHIQAVEDVVDTVPDVFDRVVTFYYQSCDITRTEVVTWILSAKRLGICKDVCKLIAFCLWETRRCGRNR